jgi:hypothetical protein
MKLRTGCMYKKRLWLWLCEIKIYPDSVIS